MQKIIEYKVSSFTVAGVTPTHKNTCNNKDGVLGCKQVTTPSLRVINKFKDQKYQFTQETTYTTINTTDCFDRELKGILAY